MKRLLPLAILATLLTAALALAAGPTAKPVAPAGAAPATKGGYLFTTFKGEQTPMTEQIYLGLSQDGHTWSALNNGEPVLVSKLGEKGVRDPYLLRTPENKFVLIATDLSIALNKDWGRAQNAGSKSIVIWESDDLVKWSEPRLVKVAPDDAGCTWAPEAIYDPDTQDYLVYWASKTRGDNFTKQRIWAARTKDFKTFSAPFIYIEKPNTVIDTDIIKDGTGGGTYYRFTKDEKDKAITMEKAEKIAGPWTDVEGFSLSKMTGYEGPACFQLEPAADGKPAKWCLLLDYYSRSQGYKPFTTTDIASGKFTADPNITFPFRFRHGSVLALTPEEYTRVKAAYAK